METVNRQNIVIKTGIAEPYFVMANKCSDYLKNELDKTKSFTINYLHPRAISLFKQMKVTVIDKTNKKSKIPLYEVRSDKSTDIGLAFKLARFQAREAIANLELLRIQRLLKKEYHISLAYWVVIDFNKSKKNRRETIAHSFIRNVIFKEIKRKVVREPYWILFDNNIKKWDALTTSYSTFFSKLYYVNEKQDEELQKLKAQFDIAKSKFQYQKAADIVIKSVKIANGETLDEK